MKKTAAQHEKELKRAIDALLTYSEIAQRDQAVWNWARHQRIEKHCQAIAVHAAAAHAAWYEAGKNEPRLLLEENA